MRHPIPPTRLRLSQWIAAQLPADRDGGWGFVGDLCQEPAHALLDFSRGQKFDLDRSPLSALALAAVVVGVGAATVDRSVVAELADSDSQAATSSRSGSGAP